MFSSRGTVVIADLNQDGYPDIVFSNHSLEGNHKTNSFIYWGASDGFSPGRKTELPAVGPHNMFSVDIGNLYTRKLEEEYQSAPYHSEEELRLDRLEWRAETPFGTGVRFQVRTADSKEALEHAKWGGPGGESSYWLTSGDRMRESMKNWRWMQYRVFLTTPDGGNTPRLHEVSVFFGK